MRFSHVGLIVYTYISTCISHSSKTQLPLRTKYDNYCIIIVFDMLTRADLLMQLFVLFTEMARGFIRFIIRPLRWEFLHHLSSMGWYGWLVRKALTSHQGDPGSIPGRGHMWVELCVGSLLYHKGFPDHPVFLYREKKYQTLSIFGCAPWSWVDVAGSQRRPCIPASRTHCSRVLHNSALNCE